MAPLNRTGVREWGSDPALEAELISKFGEYPDWIHPPK
jgi:hypothetical protein